MLLDDFYMMYDYLDWEIIIIDWISYLDEHSTNKNSKYALHKYKRTNNFNNK